MTLQRVGILLGGLAACTLCLCANAAEPRRFYQLESAQIIKSSTEPDWNYLAFDPSRNFLYIARRDDGVLEYDTKAKRVVGVLEDTAGGNAATIVPELDRIFVTSEDGRLTVIALSTLKTLKRIQVGKSADNAFYDGVTKQLLVTMGDDSLATFVDARSGATVATLSVQSKNLEGAVADGHGNFFMALRDKGTVVRVDAKAHKLTGEFTPTGCTLPNSVAFDAANERVLVGCRGDHPILAVMDLAGRTVGSATIGRGIDSIVFDAAAKRVYTANGFDGTLVILDQVDANSYKLAEAATTRPYARTMALDPVSKNVYLVCAEGTVDVSESWKNTITSFYPNKFFLNTFTLLTYTRK
jgi:DNA-binding beta-propeller fold protein YncE